MNGYIVLKSFTIRSSNIIIIYVNNKLIYNCKREKVVWNMENDKIEFFRNSINDYCDNVIKTLEYDKQKVESMMELYQIKKLSITDKAYNFFKVVLHAGAKIAFMNSVSDNVNAGDLDVDLDKLNLRRVEDTDHIRAKKKLYKYQYKVFEQLIELYRKVKEMLQKDENVVRFANAMYDVNEICKRHNHSDYTYVVMFLEDSKLISYRNYQDKVIVEDFHIEFPFIDKYRFNFRVREYVKEVLKRYNATYGHKFETTNKHK